MNAHDCVGHLRRLQCELCIDLMQRHKSRLLLLLCNKSFHYFFNEQCVIGYSLLSSLLSSLTEKMSGERREEDKRKRKVLHPPDREGVAKEERSKSTEQTEHGQRSTEQKT